MRENVRDRDRLEHIVEAIVNILDFADGKTKEELEADKLRYYGIVKNIEIIGEASYKLTHAFCSEHPDWVDRWVSGTVASQLEFFSEQ